MKKILLSFTVLLLSACSIFPTPIDLNNVEAVTSNTTISYDDFSKDVIVSAPYFNCAPRGQGKRANVSLKAIKTQTSKVFHHYIYIDYHSQNGWAFFDQGYDSNGKKLKVETVKQKVYPSAWINEVHTIPVSYSYLKKHVKNGLNIKIYGSGDTLIVPFSGAYIQGYLNTIQKANKRK